jgi:hypothetical protein
MSLCTGLPRRGDSFPGLHVRPGRHHRHPSSSSIVTIHHHHPSSPSIIIITITIHHHHHHSHLCLLKVRVPDQAQTGGGLARPLGKVREAPKLDL